MFRVTKSTHHSPIDQTTLQKTGSSTSLLTTCSWWTNSLSSAPHLNLLQSCLGNRERWTRIKHIIRGLFLNLSLLQSHIKQMFQSKKQLQRRTDSNNSLVLFSQGRKMQANNSLKWQWTNYLATWTWWKVGMLTWYWASRTLPITWCLATIFLFTESIKDKWMNEV